MQSCCVRMLTSDFGEFEFGEFVNEVLTFTGLCVCFFMREKIAKFYIDFFKKRLKLLN